MAGKLIQVANHLVASGSEVQIVKLESCITTNDVHLLVANNITVGAAGGICDIQPLVDSTADTTSNIDVAWINFNQSASGAYQNFGNANQSIWRITDGMNEVPNAAHFIMYLHNFNSSSEFSYITTDIVSHQGSHLYGFSQGGVKTETTAYNGVQIETNQSGGGGFQAKTQYTLYKIES
tara:strand:- start:380 stop:916 length:537 start_codon:yes stop_codon:yes gene_type:complete